MFDHVYIINAFVKLLDKHPVILRLSCHPGFDPRPWNHLSTWHKLAKKRIPKQKDAKILTGNYRGEIVHIESKTHSLNNRKGGDFFFPFIPKCC